jgi:hypothetical protein
MQTRVCHTLQNVTSLPHPQRIHTKLHTYMKDVLLIILLFLQLTCDINSNGLGQKMNVRPQLLFFLVAPRFSSLTHASQSR